MKSNDILKNIFVLNILEKIKLLLMLQKYLNNGFINY